MLLIKNNKCRNVRNQKCFSIRNYQTRKLLISNQLGTSILTLTLQMRRTVSRFNSLFTLITILSSLSPKITEWLRKFYHSMKSLHLFVKKQTTTFCGFQIFEYALWEKTLKTWKHQKSTDSFVKQRIPMANICNYCKTAIWYTIQFLLQKLEKLLPKPFSGFS